MTGGDYVFIMSTLQKEEPFVGKTDHAWILTPANEKQVPGSAALIDLLVYGITLIRFLYSI